MRALLLLCLLAIPFCAIASTDGSPVPILSDSQNVLFAKVKTVKGNAVEFSITEVLKGKPHSSPILKLTSGAGETFKPDQEFVLCWMGEEAQKGFVSSSLSYGDPEWLSIPVSRDGQKITVSGIGSLEKVKKICSQKSASH